MSICRIEQALNVGVIRMQIWLQSPLLMQRALFLGVIGKNSASLFTFGENCGRM